MCNEPWNIVPEGNIEKRINEAWEKGFRGSKNGG